MSDLINIARKIAHPKREQIPSLKVPFPDEFNVPWFWTGALSNGTPRAKWEGRVLRVHRLLYEQLIGPLPAGFWLSRPSIPIDVNPMSCRLIRTPKAAKPDPTDPYSLTAEEIIEAGLC